MFVLSLLIGIYSYSIFLLGITNQLYKKNLLTLFILFIFIGGFILFKKRYSFQINRQVKFNKLIIISLLIIFSQGIINLIGTLGPELSFDALWYHLTLPKIYLTNHSIFYIPGGLLYYSTMPKLIEMLYISALAFKGQILAKFIHYVFGLLSLIALYQLARKFLSKTYSLLVVVVFYSNLVVGWQSITAYIDLSRTFFEILSLYYFVNFYETRNKKWLIKSSIILGLAISTKLLSLGSIIIFIIILFDNFKLTKTKLKNLFSNLAFFIFPSLLVPLPWFIFSYLTTKNPVYPFFSQYYQINSTINLINPLNFIKNIWILFTYSADPLNPIYIIILPLIILSFKRLKKELRIISLYSIMAIVIWYLTPKTGGGRFIMPYLPAISLLIVWTIKNIKENYLKTFHLSLIILLAIISIGYRSLANKKYLPVILKKQTDSQFLTNNLNFSFGDFYDTDSYFKKHLKKTDRVLIYGIHNLYYVDFPFIHQSYLKKENKFNYILTQNSILPDKFKSWKQIYQNKITHVKLYDR